MTNAMESPEDIAAKVEARVREEEDLNLAPAKTPPGDLVTPEFIRSCLANNERGDGILYSVLHRDRLVYVKKSQEWMCWNGHTWEDDVFQEHLRHVEAVALTYLAEADKLEPGIARQRAALDKAKGKLKDAQSKLKDADRASKAAAKASDAAAMADAEAAATAAQDAISQAESDVRGAATQLAILLSEQKAFHRRIDRLRSVNGMEKCATCAHIVEHPLAISGDEIDQQPWLLPCANGVIDLRTGELSDGRPGDWLVKSSPVAFPGFHAECPEWEKFLESILPDEEVRDFLGMLFGYSITGLSVEQFIAVFVGPGRNGKGLFFEIIEQILGPLYWTVQSELLLENKNARSSAGASPDIVALRGRRIAAASETDEGRRISAARIKELTGADTLNARLLYDKHDTNFRPTHKLFLRTNSIPAGLTKDFALRERLIYIRFPYMFVDDPKAKALEDPNNAALYRLKDRGLKVRLMAELPGILAWLVRKCAQWQADGRLKPPKQIMSAIEELHQEEDVVGRFIAERCCRADPGEYVVYNDLYKAFVEWYCEDEGIEDPSKTNKYIPSNKKVSKELKNKGFESPPKAETGGSKRIYGLLIA